MAHMIGEKMTFYLSWENWNMLNAWWRVKSCCCFYSTGNMKGLMVHACFPPQQNMNRDHFLLQRRMCEGRRKRSPFLQKNKSIYTCIFQRKNDPSWFVWWFLFRGKIHCLIPISYCTMRWFLSPRGGGGYFLSGEQWIKGPLVIFGYKRGGYTTQFCGDYNKPL